MKEFIIKRLAKLKSYQYKRVNFRFLLWTLTLSIIGILVIDSAAMDDPSYVKKQIFGLAVGIVVMLIIALFDYHFVLKFYWLIYAFMLVLLLAVKVMGSSAGGAMRWFEVAGIKIQPSEFTKVFIILFFAKFIMKHHAKFNTFKVIASCVALLAVPLALVFLQPDLSTSILIGLLFCSIMYIAGISYKVIFSLLAAAVPIVVVLVYLIFQPNQNILRGYQLQRIIAFYNKDSEFSDDLMYQQENSINAIGSGGLWGKGLKNDNPESVKNGNYLAAAHTDFIFAVVGEELGFAGTVTVIVLLFLIIAECFYTGIHAPDIAGRIIACSYGALIGFQALINLAVVTMIIPNTGLTLPFVSYGLSSLISLFIGAGFIINISLQHKKLI